MQSRYTSLDSFAADWQEQENRRIAERVRKDKRSIAARKGVETRRFNARVAKDRATIAAQRSKTVQPVLSDSAAKRVR